MKPALLAFLIILQIKSHAQGDTTYCISLKPPSTEQLFVVSAPENLPPAFHNLYEITLIDWGKIVSRFDEAPIANSTHPVFRSITVGAFNDPKDVRIATIQKQDTSVFLTFKFMFDQKRSRIVVYRKLLPLKTWEDFLRLSEKYFVNQSTHKESSLVVHDGTSTIYEGNVSGSYHFLARHVMAVKDPELLALDRFLMQEVGEFFDPECEPPNKKSERRKKRS